MMKNHKSDRIIILTTHFMDEADFLGDRIGIMSDGKLMCCGSTIFLKNKYGVGYNLTVSKLSTSVPSQPITELIQKYIPQAKITTNVSSEISYQLPMDTVSYFSKMFDELDSNKTKLRYESYGVSITTLEEVFLKVAEIRHDPIEEEVNSDKIKFSDDNMIKDLVDNRDYYDVQPEEGTRFWRHIKALWVKRFWMVVKDYKSVVYEFVYPIAIIILALFLIRTDFMKSKPAQVMDWSVFNEEGRVMLPISGNQTALNSSLAAQLNTDFGDYVTVTDYSSRSIGDLFFLYFTAKTPLEKGCHQ